MSYRMYLYSLSTHSALHCIHAFLFCGLVCVDCLITSIYTYIFSFHFSVFGGLITPADLSRLSLGAACSSCLEDGGERPNERVIKVGIGWVLLANATSGFSGYIKLAYCSSAKGLQ